MHRTVIYNHISQERNRQDAKWGDQSGLSPVEWLSVLTEEVGEAAQQANHLHFAGDAARRLDRQDLITELTQIAAVAVAWLETLEQQ